MKNYIAYLILDNVRTKIEFSTDIRPVEYLWQRYGMSTFIESLEEVLEAPAEETEEPKKTEEEKKV